MDHYFIFFFFSLFFLCVKVRSIIVSNFCLGRSIFTSIIMVYYVINCLCVCECKCVCVRESVSVEKGEEG